MQSILDDYRPIVSLQIGPVHTLATSQAVQTCVGLWQLSFETALHLLSSSCAHTRPRSELVNPYDKEACWGRCGVPQADVPAHMTQKHSSFFPQRSGSMPVSLTKLSRVGPTSHIFCFQQMFHRSGCQGISVAGKVLKLQGRRNMSMLTDWGKHAKTLMVMSM